MRSMSWEIRQEKTKTLCLQQTIQIFSIASARGELCSVLQNNLKFAIGERVEFFYLFDPNYRRTPNARKLFRVVCLLHSFHCFTEQVLFAVLTDLDRVSLRCN